MKPMLAPFRSPPQPRGVSSIELVVAFTLLSIVLSVGTGLLVRHARLLAAHRDYQVALDEVSNQLERLTALPADELPAALEQLKPSSFAAEHLPEAELKGNLDQADLGQRLTLQLTWDEPQRRSAPVTLAAWMLPLRSEP